MSPSDRDFRGSSSLPPKTVPAHKREMRVSFIVTQSTATGRSRLARVCFPAVEPAYRRPPGRRLAGVETVGFYTPSLPAQGGQCRSFRFNIRWANSREVCYLLRGARRNAEQ